MYENKTIFSAIPDTQQKYIISYTKIDAKQEIYYIDSKVARTQT